MDKFGKKRTSKQKNIYKKYLVWLINYILEPIIKSVERVKDQIMSLFKTKDYSQPKPVKIVYGDGKKQSKENIIKV